MMMILLHGIPIGQTYSFAACPDFSSSYLFLVFTAAIWFRLGDAIGESCSTSGLLIKRCYLGTHIFCDRRDNICKCKPQYPVKISNHRCGTAKSYQEGCYINMECSYKDKNAYCNIDTIRNVRTCDCLPRYSYSKSHGLCELEREKNEEGPSYIISAMIGIIISCCIGLFACFLVIPMLRSQNSLRESLSARWSIRRQSRTPSNRPTEEPSAPPTETNNDSLPSYETVVLSASHADQEPPPEYDVAVKSSPSFWFKDG